MIPDFTSYFSLVHFSNWKSNSSGSNLLFQLVTHLFYPVPQFYSHLEMDFAWSFVFWNLVFIVGCLSQHIIMASDFNSQEQLLISFGFDHPCYFQQKCAFSFYFDQHFINFLNSQPKILTQLSSVVFVMLKTDLNFMFQ